MKKEKKIKSAKQKKEQKNHRAICMILGMYFVAAIGTVIGFARNNIGIICMCVGVSIGMCIGMAIGSTIKKDNIDEIMEKELVEKNNKTK